MSKALITIDSWISWISQDKQKWFDSMVWVDIFREDWIVQINRKLNAINSWNDVTTDVISSFCEFVVSWTRYLLAQETAAKLYKSSNSWSTWATANTNTAWSSWDRVWFDLVVFNWYLYYTTKTYLWRTADLSTFVDNYKAFLIWTSLIHPMIVFQNKLYIWDWYNLSELNTAWTALIDAIFTLPTDEIIYSLEVFWNNLAVWTQNWNLYIWDWSSANSSAIIYSDNWPITAIKQLNNTLFIFAWLYWYIYTYNGADMLPYLRIPNFISLNRDDLFASTTVIHTWVKWYKNWIIFWYWWNWVYVLNKNKSWDSFSLIKYWSLSWSLWSTIKPIPFIIQPDKWGDYLIVWWDKKMDSVTEWLWTYFYTQWDAYIETPIYDITDSNWQDSLIQWFQVLLWTAAEVWALYTDASSKIKLSYKIDRATNYTALTTEITSSNDEKIIFEIFKRWREIQFKIDLWDSSWNNTKLRQIKIY